MKDMYGITVDEAKLFAYDPDNDKDFSSFATQIMNCGCDGLLGASYQNDGGLIMRAVGDLGFDKPCFGANSAYVDQVAIDIAGDYAVGWYCTADWAYQTPVEEGHKFAEDYNSKYGRYPNLNAAVTQDGVRLLINAIETAGSAEREDINNAMAKTKDFQGVTSLYTANGFNSLAQTLLVLQNQEGGTTDVIGTVERPQ